ncbi:CoA ester lyase [Micrococcaceae bacterium Sec5.1]
MSFAEKISSAETFLFVSAAQPDRFEKAAEAGADVVIIDLEDAVASGLKSESRRNVADHLLRSQCLVRINSAHSPYFDDDVAALAGSPGLIGVMLPKAEDVNELDQVAALFPGTPVVALIESARGLDSAREIASHPAVVRLAFGNLDFAADLGIAPGVEENELHYAFAHLVLAGRLADQAAPIAGVTTNFREPLATASDARRQKSFGFGGKLLIHPAQIQPTAEIFAPTAAEVEWARKVISVSVAADGGAAQLDGAMIDRPVMLRAERITRGRGPV